MKSTSCLRPTVNALLLIVTAAIARPCGPYIPHIPSVQYFHLSEQQEPYSADDERDENLALWQEMTSPRIPLADIEQAVYRDTGDGLLRNISTVSLAGGNRFYSYLRDRDPGAARFLLLAKQLEKARSLQSSPWYYPARKGTAGAPECFDAIIDSCRAYSGDRLKTRYGLQGVRALFASGRYSDCVEYFRETFDSVPATDLMKRMAMRYIAGCMARMELNDSADSLFALAGDILSITPGRRLELMARLNPAAPALIQYLRHNTRDTALMLVADTIATSLIADPRVKYKGDWHFFRAHVAGEILGDPSTARCHILRATPGSFSSPSLADLGRAYRMKLDGLTGHRGNMLADLSWLEKKARDTDETGYLYDYDIDVGRYSSHFTDILKNIIYSAWVPRLWHDGDKAIAILLASHADNLDHAGTLYAARPHSTDYSYVVKDYFPIGRLRKSTEYSNPADYKTLSFQMMYSLPSAELSGVVDAMLSGQDPLYRFLRSNVRTDLDFYRELIGTIALREENYSRAEAYLSLVSPRYEHTLNVDKARYLSRDPFTAYPSRRFKGEYYDGTVYDYETRAGVHDRSRARSAKLRFARRMLQLSMEMKTAPTPDRRGLARVAYAMGRRNSLEECWALTQYWRGSYVGLFVPSEWYRGNDSPATQFDFIYNYMDTPLAANVERTYSREVAAALAMLETDEARAEAQLMLGHRATVVRRYGDTPAARRLKAACDNWRDWL